MIPISNVVVRVGTEKTPDFTSGPVSGPTPRFKVDSREGEEKRRKEAKITS